MAIKEKRGKPQIDLSGPQGNAFALIGQARTLAKQIGKDANAITDRMMQGSYEDLVQVFDDEFGHFVDLVR